MNRYLLVDFENNCISNLSRVETDFEENETQTSSITCRDKKDLLEELRRQIKDYSCGITEENKYFIDEQYEKMKSYIYNTNDEELKQHYDWYKVEYGDKVELVDSMFESYCNSYDDEQLEKAINRLLEVK